jgi:hypothetical protein
MAPPRAWGSATTKDWPTPRSEAACPSVPSSRGRPRSSPGEALAATSRESELLNARAARSSSNGWFSMAIKRLYTKRVRTCYRSSMARGASARVNVILDEERSLKLQRLAERTNVNPGTLARSLLSTALDEADPEPRDVTALLDAIDGAWERAQLGLEEATRGEGIPLEDL